MSTNSLTTAVVTYLNLNGFFVWRNNTVGIYDPKKGIFRKNKNQQKGISDIIGMRKTDGKFIAIEIKTGRDKLSQDQIKFGQKITEYNAIHHVVKKLSDVIELLNQIQ